MTLDDERSELWELAVRTSFFGDGADCIYVNTFLHHSPDLVNTGRPNKHRGSYFLPVTYSSGESVHLEIPEQVVVDKMFEKYFCELDNLPKGDRAVLLEGNSFRIESRESVGIGEVVVEGLRRLTRFSKITGATILTSFAQPTFWRRMVNCKDSEDYNLYVGVGTVFGLPMAFVGCGFSLFSMIDGGQTNYPNLALFAGTTLASNSLSFVYECGRAAYLGLEGKVLERKKKSRLEEKVSKKES